MGIGTTLDKCQGVVGRMAGSGPDKRSGCYKR